MYSCATGLRNRARVSGRFSVRWFCLRLCIWTHCQVVNGTFAIWEHLFLVLFGVSTLSSILYGRLSTVRDQTAINLGEGIIGDGGFVLSPEERDRIVVIFRDPGHWLDMEGAEGDEAPFSGYRPISALPRSSRSQRDT